MGKVSIKVERHHGLEQLCHGHQPNFLPKSSRYLSIKNTAVNAKNRKQIEHTLLQNFLQFDSSADLVPLLLRDLQLSPCISMGPLDLHREKVGFSFFQSIFCMVQNLNPELKQDEKSGFRKTIFCQFFGRVFSKTSLLYLVVLTLYLKLVLLDRAWKYLFGKSVKFCRSKISTRECTSIFYTTHSITLPFGSLTPLQAI